MTGMTLGVAAAVNYPAPFVSDNVANYAVVCGSNAAASDFTASSSIGDYLETLYEQNTNQVEFSEGDFSNSVGVIEDEVPLGGSIITGKIKEVLKDNKISTLIDGDIDWDDGENSKTSFNVHEVIELSNLNIETSLDDNDFEEVVLTNDEGILYKYVFEETLDIDEIRDNDADDLYLTILGKRYEIKSMDDNSFSVISSQERMVTEGETIIVDGISLTVGAIFENGKLLINDQFVGGGSGSRVDGIRITIDDVAYRDGGDSKAIIRVGKDLTNTFNSGDEYIEDDDTWVWRIKDPGVEGGYIGVQYNLRTTEYDDEGLVEIGQGYVLPENYASVQFLGFTDVDYEEFKVSFDREEVYKGETPLYEGHNVDLALIKGDTDESIVIGDYETEAIYLKQGEETVNETEGSVTIEVTYPTVELYFKDIDGDLGDENDIQYVDTYILNEPAENIAKLVVDDTELSVGASLNEENETILSIGDVEVKLGGDGTKFLYLGDDEDDAETNEVSINGQGIGNEEEDIMDYSGVIVKSPESNSEKDVVILDVPSDQVYAKVAVLGQGEEIVDSIDKPTELGAIILKDSEVSAFSNKNLIVVGGSCINTVAATLIGSSACGTDFTSATSVGTGQYLVKAYTSPYNSEKIAVLVAGYEAGDTVRAATTIANGLDLSVGKEYRG